MVYPWLIRENIPNYDKLENGQGNSKDDNFNYDKKSSRNYLNLRRKENAFAIKLAKVYP